MAPLATPARVLARDSRRHAPPARTRCRAPGGFADFRRDCWARLSTAPCLQPQRSRSGHAASCRYGVGTPLFRGYGNVCISSRVCTSSARGVVVPPSMRSRYASVPSRGPRCFTTFLFLCASNRVLSPTLTMRLSSLSPLRSCCTLTRSLSRRGFSFGPYTFPLPEAECVLHRSAPGGHLYRFTRVYAHPLSPIHI